MSVDGESPQQAEVSKEMVEKGATQVNEDVISRIENEQRTGVLVFRELAKVYGTQRGESARVALMANK
ncbi:hypothetical protein RHGRI_021124 [Rhododendron griersonianum]|uniref:Uncharacterized protein n=1 Tax=Rhododendron griersonianum TaxID=479676 RepID=A0AAV6JMX6_9ERIC|nr:hypothetical protein RHGRI_021124 [Rhododendron griersonianum]